MSAWPDATIRCRPLPLFRGAHAHARALPRTGLHAGVRARSSRARAGRCSRPPGPGPIPSARESARRVRTPLDEAQIGHEGLPPRPVGGWPGPSGGKSARGAKAENSCLQSTHRALSRPGSCGLEGRIEGRPSRRRSHRRRLKRVPPWLEEPPKHSRGSGSTPCSRMPAGT